MPCFHPLNAWYTDSGQISFKPTSKNGKPMQLPCGRCTGCRLEKSRTWATRCMHEASLYDQNCFITLTYDNFGKDGPTLVKADFQKFMKRLRHHTDKRDKKIKYFMCGEYGDKNQRPHYHAIIFNYDFPDWVYRGVSPSGHDLYTSPLLEKIWQTENTKGGFVQVGTVTFESAAYVARYCTKKITGDLANEIDPSTGLKHYERFDPETGEIIEVIPEYATMSRGGRNGRGIAYDWISQYTGDVYPKDHFHIRGNVVKPPRYYDNYLEENNPELLKKLKEKRLQAQFENFDEGSTSRLRQKEIVSMAQYRMLKRSL
jgi:hypothetical protein